MAVFDLTRKRHQLEAVNPKTKSIIYFYYFPMYVFPKRLYLFGDTYTVVHGSFNKNKTNILPACGSKQRPQKYNAPKVFELNQLRITRTYLKISQMFLLKILNYKKLMMIFIAKKKRYSKQLLQVDLILN